MSRFPLQRSFPPGIVCVAPFCWSKSFSLEHPHSHPAHPHMQDPVQQQWFPCRTRPQLPSGHGPWGLRKGGPTVGLQHCLWAGNLDVWGNKKIRKSLGALEQFQPWQNAFPNFILCKIMAPFNCRNRCFLSMRRHAACSQDLVSICAFTLTQDGFLPLATSILCRSQGLLRPVSCPWTLNPSSSPTYSLRPQRHRYGTVAAG